MRSLRLDDQNTDIAFACVMNRLPKTFRKLEVEAVVRRMIAYEPPIVRLRLEVEVDKV